MKILNQRLVFFNFVARGSREKNSTDSFGVNCIADWCFCFICDVY